MARFDTCRARTATITATVMMALLVLPAWAGAAAESHRVQSTTDENIALHVVERRPDDASDRDAAVLFVHGATYPGVTFDTPLSDGPSWLQRTAEDGYHAFAMDVRGYGRSTRPAAIAAPAEENAPFARAETVIHDIDDVVEFIRERTGVDKVNLVGWSWGTVTTGMYTARHGDKVERLVLYAPVYSDRNEAWTAKLADPDNPEQLADVGAYRTVTREQADERWASQIDADDSTEWRDPAVFDDWFSAMLRMEPGDDVTQVKAPNGVLVDIWEIFHERPVYDAAKIDVPTLVIRGDDDPTSTDADARGLYAALSSATKRYVVIGDGTHFVCMEKNAPQLFAETALFLDGAE